MAWTGVKCKRPGWFPTRVWGREKQMREPPQNEAEAAAQLHEKPQGTLTTAKSGFEGVGGLPHDDRLRAVPHGEIKFLIANVEVQVALPVDVVIQSDEQHLEIRAGTERASKSHDAIVQIGKTEHGLLAQITGQLAKEFGRQFLQWGRGAVPHRFVQTMDFVSIQFVGARRR